MNYKTHVVGGLSAGFLTSQFILNTTQFNMDTTEAVDLSSVTILGGIIGALLPDIDKSNSFISHRAKITSAVMCMLFDHRGITHVPLVNALFSSILMFMANAFLDGIFKYIILTWLIGLTVGIFSHLFLDCLNGQGIPIFYPFIKKKYHLIDLPCNGVSGFIVSTLIIVGTIFTYKPTLIPNIINLVLNS